MAAESAYMEEPIAAARTMTFRGARVAWWLAIVLYAFAFLFVVNSAFTDRRNEADAWQNVVSAWNVWQHGTFSSRGGDPPPPDNVREPLPPLLIALQMRFDPRFAGADRLEDLKTGPPLRALKQHNLFWTLVCQLLVAVLAFRAAEPALSVHWRGAVALAACAGTGLFLFTSWPYVDRNMTEVQAATLLVLACLLSLEALARRSIWLFGALGAALGLCALVKASLLYVSAAYLAALFLFLLLKGFSRRGAASRILAAALGAALVCAPWLARNAVSLGEVKMAERGGAVLYLRAVENRMTPEEWRGAFFMHAPGTLRPLLSALTGFTREDTMRGGPLQRLNRDRSDFAEDDDAAKREGRPDKAISLYALGIADWKRLRLDLEAQGVPDAEDRADATMQRRAIDEILSHPLAHLEASVPIFWKGIWSLRSPFGWLNVVVALGGTLALLGLAVASFLTRDERAFAVAVLPAGILAFFALATHFINRYSAPVIPLTTLAFVLVASSLLHRLVGTRAPRNAPEAA